MPLLGIPKSLYREPERLTPSEARLRRVQSELRKVELLERARPSLSQANQYHLQKLKEFEQQFHKELDVRREQLKRAEKAHANSQSIKSASRLKAAMLAASNLQKRRTTLRQKADVERRANILKEASAPNSRYGLSGFVNPRNIYGVEATTSVNAQSRRYFKHPLLSIPCIERMIRREVIFARGHGGRGHRGKRRFNPLSYIGC